MSEEIQWITINGAPVPLNAQGEPLNEVGEKILGEAAKKREKASTASNQEKEPKAEGVAEQGEARKTAEGNRETKAETGRTITKSDGIAYSKTYGEYLEECDGNAEKAAREFFQRQLFGKSVVRDIEGENLEVFFTARSWRKLSHNMRDDPIKAEIVPHLPEIIFSGAYTENPLHKERSDGIIAFYEFRQIVHTSAGDLDVFVDVAEHPAAEQSPYAYNLTRQGRRNYENRLEYETKKRLPHLRPDSDGETSSDRSIVAIDIIPTSFELVNIRFAGEPFEFEEDEMPRDRPNGDRLVFDVKTSKRHKDSNGYLHVEGSNITKEQIAPYYGREIPGWEGLGLAPHRLYYMYRPAEELEKAAGDFNGMPLLFEHHDTDASNPAKEFLIGSLGTDAEFKAPYVVSSLVITDGEAVAALERGDYKELSAGYHYDPVMTGGVFDGDHYDGYMTNIRPNHVALVKEGRAGPDVAVADQKPQGLEIRAEKPPRRESKDMENNAFKLDLETLTKAVQALLAKCREPGVDEDPVIQEVTDQFFPDAGEEDKKKVMEMLLAIKPEPVKDEPGPEGEENQEDEVLKKAMADCSIDSDNPEAVKAFAEGMKYAEKLAENHADEEKADKEDKLQELAKELEEQKATMDSRLKSLKEKAIEDTKAHYKALYKAAQDCRPVLGVLADPLTFDSAGDIYRKALVTAGVDVKGVHPSAFPAMLKMVQSQGQKQSFAAPTMATDSKDSNFLQGAAEGLARIQL